MFKFLRNLFKPKNLMPKSSFQNGYGILFLVWGLIIFTVFTGALRKWVVGEGTISNIFLLIQLVLPLMFYILVLKNPLPKTRKVPGFWIVYMLYLVLIALNPMNQTLYHGLLGLLLHTGYWLIWLAYLQKGCWMELEKLIPVLTVILIVEFILASLQYSLPSTNYLNVLASGEETRAYVGDAVRTSGTFSYIGGFQSMIPLFACLAWFMVLKNYKFRWVIVIMTTGLVMALMTGSRRAVAFYLLYSVMIFVFSGDIFSKTLKMLFQLVIISMIVILLLPSIQSFVTNTFDNFLYRFETSDNVENRLKGHYSDAFYFSGNYPIFGVGLGATYQGANALFGKSMYVKEYGYYESEPARIILEGGYILFLFRLLLLIVFLKKTKNLPLLVKLFFAVIYLNTMVTFNIYAGVFFVLGLMLVDRGYYLKQVQKKNLKLDYS